MRQKVKSVASRIKRSKLKMIYNIKPYEGVGELKFGMTRSEIEKIIGEKPLQIKKTPFSKTKTDVFQNYGMHIYYNLMEQCEAIEFGTPATVTFNEEELLNQTYKMVEQKIKRIDSELAYDETGFISYKLGIGVFVPTLKKSKNEKVQGVIVFEKGYYD